MFKHCEGGSSSKMEVTVLFLSYPDKKRKKAVVSERSSNESKQIFHNITHLQRFFSYLVCI